MSTSFQTDALVPADEHNRTLVENLHPPGWKNPEPKTKYNLVVIGAGTAGLVAAAGAATLGARVALIERHLMGGDCTNYGCVPSKALIRSARVAYAARQASEYGINGTREADVAFPRVMERMRRLRAQISSNDSVARFSSLGIDVYLGDAQFSGRHEVEVAGSTLPFSKAVIATGARPATLPIAGLAAAGYLTNETVFSLQELPRKLLVIGSGPIGCELAQTFRRFGSEVVIVTDVMRLLPKDDPDASEVLKKRFEGEGVQMLFGANIVRAENGGTLKRLVIQRGRVEERVEGTEILVAAGRHANVDGLQAEAAGVKYDQDGIAVNDRLQTANPDIYAAGDVCSRYKFTHAAEAMARIALQNALLFGRKRMSNLVIPWCTYTSPEVAHVGISGDEVLRSKMPILTFTRMMADTDRAILDGETDGFVRLHLRRGNGTVVGATFVGAHAGESIGEVVLAMTRGLKARDLSAAIHPYPTQADALKRAADLHLRSRLGPTVQRLLKRYFKFRR